MNTYEVSIVIPTINNPSLPDLLNGLERQDYDMSCCEVIVIEDKNSKTFQCSRLNNNFSYSLNYYLNKKTKGPAACRNIGIRNSKGRIIAFIDDDCLPAVDWVAKLVGEFKKEKAEVIAGVVEPLEQKAVIQRYCKFAGILTGPVFSQDNKVSYLLTANCAFRREILEEVNGFDEKYFFPGAEDNDISLRIRSKGYNISYCPQLLVFHQHDSRVLKWLKKYFFYGLGSAIFEKLNNTSGIGGNIGFKNLFSIFRFPFKVSENLKKGVSVKEALAFPVLSYIMNAFFMLGRIYGKIFSVFYAF